MGSADSAPGQYGYGCVSAEEGYDGEGCEKEGSGRWALGVFY